MLSTKGLLAKIMERLARPVINTSFSGKSASSGTYTTLGTITLPANGTYMVFAVINCGATSGTFADNYYSARTRVTSGTPDLSYNGQQKAHAQGGGGASLSGIYRTGNSSVTVAAEIYMYGSMTTSAANGQLWAVPVVSKG